jgi:tetratricopeptide (TPR) repeat protein
MNYCKQLFADGVAAFKRGDYKDAVTWLESVTLAEPDNFGAFVYLGAAYAAIERFNAAIGALKKAEELKPDAASIHYNLGQAYEAAGVPRQAICEYQRALEIDKRYGLARGALVALENKIREIRTRRIAA